MNNDFYKFGFKFLPINTKKSYFSDIKSPKFLDGFYFKKIILFEVSADTSFINDNLIIGHFHVLSHHG